MNSKEHAGMVIYEAPFAQDSPAADILEPFVREEYLCRKIGEGAAPLLHIWRHPRAMVLGLRDRRLPRAEQAMRQLEREGWSVCVRSSGGAAVALDPGVVNASVILPNPAGKINIHDDFSLMASLISRAVKPWSPLAAAGEIAGAFCPGDYDISINGRKFCGIAQRRQAKAYIITAFIIVDGSGDERANQVRNFYGAASGGQAGGYPVVEKGTMGSLQELAGVPSAEEFIDSLKQAAEERFGSAAAFDARSMPEFVLPENVKLEMIAKMRSRYDN